MQSAHPTDKLTKPLHQVMKTILEAVQMYMLDPETKDHGNQRMETTLVELCQVAGESSKSYKVLKSIVKECFSVSDTIKLH